MRDSSVVGKNKKGDRQQKEMLDAIKNKAFETVGDLTVSTDKDHLERLAYLNLNDADRDVITKLDNNSWKNYVLAVTMSFLKFNGDSSHLLNYIAIKNALKKLKPTVEGNSVRILCQEIPLTQRSLRLEVPALIKVFGKLEGNKCTIGGKPDTIPGGREGILKVDMDPFPFLNRYNRLIPSLTGYIKKIIEIGVIEKIEDITIEKIEDITIEKFSIEIVKPQIEQPEKEAAAKEIIGLKNFKELEKLNQTLKIFLSIEDKLERTAKQLISELPRPWMSSRLGRAYPFFRYVENLKNKYFEQFIEVLIDLDLLIRNLNQIKDEIDAESWQMQGWGEKGTEIVENIMESIITYIKNSFMGKQLKVKKI